MRFIIKKESEDCYWTIPKNLFLRFVIIFKDIISFQSIRNIESAYDCFNTKEEAIEHIKKWNSGYYKKTKKNQIVWEGD